MLQYSISNSTDTTTQPPETTKPKGVEIVTRNDRTTALTEEKVNDTLKKNDSANNVGMTMIPALYGILVSISFFCMGCIIYRKGRLKDFHYFLLLYVIRIKTSFS